MTPEAPRHDLDAALKRLTSLHDGDAGVSEIIAFGKDAVPLLHSVLLTRDTSGFFETRCRAVAALETLRAYRVLREFLSSERWPPDPIELTGEDAVVNAAARALGRLADPADLPLLYALAQERPLAGVLEALGEYRYRPALPLFIEALGDDFARRAAEIALRKFGAIARPALLACAIEEPEPDAREQVSSINRRRSALRLLQGLPLRRAVLPRKFQQLIAGTDPWIAIWASRIALKCFDKPAHRAIIERLILHLRSANELIAEEITDILVEHYDSAGSAIEQLAAVPHEEVPAWRSYDYSAAVLQRVRKRISASAHMEWET